ncbi:MAG: PEP/pyruvate-binding domain-containing protein [Candidatus Thermochlorobacter sp.]
MFILPLGDALSAALAIGNKARLLDLARHAALPVPRGVILTHEFYTLALQKRAITLETAQVICPNPYRLLALAPIPAFRTRVAVRSAFSAEDCASESLAGFFESRLFVNRADPAAFVEALCAVWSSALRRSGNFRRDVLIMEMVDAHISGVAFTEREYEDDLVNYTSGTAEQLVSGKVEAHVLLVPKLNWYETRLACEPLPPWAERLQTLLRKVRRIFGPHDWDIEWADDGQRCWLIQLRPVTRPTRRNDAFTIANHKEILPPLPSRLMTSLIASCAHKLFAYYRHFDPSLPEQRHFIEVFIGRPFINLSLMSEMMRHWGLPTRLVTDNIGGEAGRTFGINWRRLFFHLPVLLRQGLAQLRSPQQAQATAARLLSDSQRRAHTFAEAITAMQQHYIALVTEMFSLTAAMSLPLVLLRQLGLLAEHSARLRTISTELYTDLEPLRMRVLQHPSLATALQQGKLPDDPAFYSLWQAYLQKHGHRGIYESDISRPRFSEEPQPLFAALLQSPQQHSLPQRTLLGILTFPIWQAAARPIRAREQLRYTAMRAFQQSRADFLQLAAQAEARGQLPKAEWLWHLTLEEVIALDKGAAYSSEFFEQRCTEIKRLETLSVPDFFHRFDDLEGLEAHADVPRSSHLSGISLTDGEVTGKAWVLQEPETRLPEGYEASCTILVARSVDAGWIPTFAVVAGVVVETGGDLSHGSIILREIGLPAITNVRRATQLIQTGDSLRLRAAQGIVEIAPHSA